MEQNIEKIIDDIKVRQQDLQPCESTKQMLLKSFRPVERIFLVRYWYAVAAVSFVTLAFCWLYWKSVLPINLQNEVASKSEIEPIQIEQTNIKVLAPGSNKRKVNVRQKAISKIENQNPIAQGAQQIDILNASDADITATFYRKNSNMTWEFETEDTLAKAQKIFWDIEK